MTPESIYLEIGRLIQQRRKSLELKQQNLATEMGISRGSLANIETGKQRILVHQLYTFAKKLKLSPHELLPLPKGGGRPSSDELPLPDHLSLQQKKQISQVFDQNPSTQAPQKRISHAKR